MYRVSDILNPEFARSWHEAVAIVQEIASQLAPGATIPEPEDLLIDDNGKLQLGFGPDEAQNPVSILATLLKSLLNGVDAPGGLRDLATENAKSNPALSSVSAFERALAFYERPGRASELQAIAARLRGFAPAPLEPPEDPQAEFDRLREKVAAKAEADEPTQTEKPRRRFSRRTIAIAAAVELAILGAIVVYARPHYFNQTSDLTDRVEQKLADTISSGLNKMGSGEAPGSATAAVAAEAMPAGPLEPAKASRPAPATHPVGTTLTEKAAARTPILLPTGSVPLTTGGVATGPTFTMAPAPGPQAIDIRAASRSGPEYRPHSDVYPRRRGSRSTPDYPTAVAAPTGARRRHRLFRRHRQRNGRRRAGPAGVAHAPLPGAHAHGSRQGVEVQAGAPGRAARSIPDAHCHHPFG